MYSYLFFGLVLLGLFSILQIVREDKIITNFKIHIILFLITITIINSIDFIIDLGYNSFQLLTFFRILTNITLMNVFILLGRNKISKIVFIVEIIISLIYFVTILIGTDRPTTKENYIINENEIFIIIQLLIHISLISNIIYTLFKIYQKNDTINLYQKRIKKWASLSFIFFLIVLGILIMVSVYVVNKNQFNYNDTRISLLLLRFISILFVIFRPSHIDEIGIPYLKKLKSKNRISIQNFEFIFFSNYYYLKPSANLEDFATMLNHSKTEVVAFIQTLGEVNFNEMLNKNRILYFTELLKNKKHESLTIEALSEISGFGSRNTMYNAFNKYHGMTPTEFIMIHK